MKCHCSHTQHALADIPRPGPRARKHNKIKHIRATRRTCRGSAVMERSAGAKTTVMDLHLHKSRSFPACIFRRADWSCATSLANKKYFSMRMSPGGSQEVMEQNSTWLVAGPNETNELRVFTVQFLRVSPVSHLCLYHFMSHCSFS